MTDLDERILKVNVPNKYSQWNDDNNNTNDKFVLGPTTPTTTTKRLPHKPTASNHTGVKGVLHDYHNAKQSNALQQTLQQNETHEHIRRLTSASTMKPGETSISLASLKLHPPQTRERTDSSPNESSDSDDCDDDDEAFLQSYRQKRMGQMQEMALQAQQQLLLLPVFGTLQTINLEQFTTIIDDMDTRVYCVFHLYQDGIPSCALMDQHLSLLARTMESCCIRRMDITEFKPNFDSVGFPCVLVYQAGVEVANLTPLTQYIPSWDMMGDGRFTLENVKYVLELYGCGCCRSE